MASTSDEIKAFSGHRDSVTADEVPRINDPVPNENFIYRNGSRSLLLHYCGVDKQFRPIPKHSAYGIKPRNAEQHFALECSIG